jgi:CDP-4-dehydro-6-deoxyglucose reductase
MTSSHFLLEVEGVVKQLHCAPDQTLLEVLTESGFVQRKACRNGVCEICEADLLAGQAWQRYPRVDWDAKQGVCRLLLCTSYPRSNIKLRVIRCLLPGV